MIKSKVVSIALAVVIFIVGVACGLILDKALVCRKEHPMWGAGFKAKRDRPSALLRKLGKDLDLTTEQKEKIKAILKEQKQEIDKLMNEVHPKIEAQMDIFREKIRNLLNDQQKIKFDKIVEKQKQRRKRFAGPLH